MGVIGGFDSGNYKVFTEIFNTAFDNMPQHLFSHFYIRSKQIGDSQRGNWEIDPKMEFRISLPDLGRYIILAAEFSPTETTATADMYGSSSSSNAYSSTMCKDKYMLDFTNNLVQEFPDFVSTTLELATIRNTEVESEVLSGIEMRADWQLNPDSNQCSAYITGYNTDASSDTTVLDLTLEYNCDEANNNYDFEFATGLQCPSWSGFDYAQDRKYELKYKNKDNEDQLNLVYTKSGGFKASASSLILVKTTKPSQLTFQVKSIHLHSALMPKPKLTFPTLILFRLII